MIRNLEDSMSTEQDAQNVLDMLAGYQGNIVIAEKMEPTSVLTRMIENQYRTVLALQEGATLSNENVLALTSAIEGLSILLNIEKDYTVRP